MKPHFKLPGRSKITGRESTLTGLFFTSLIPVIKPTEEEVREALRILGMSEENCVCAYCGSDKSEWDHFRPTILNKRPTGYITEIHNLVPSCGKCNQSKGNTYWKQWMVGPAKLSPKTRGVADIDGKIARLEAYERWREPTQISFEEALGVELWKNHIKNLERVNAILAEAERHAEICRTKLMQGACVANHSLEGRRP